MNNTTPYIQATPTSRDGTAVAVQLAMLNKKPKREPKRVKVKLPVFKAVKL